ncbi:MAG: tetratricopeptide repeat protein [Verrucomicrobiae bacterium]|nr:tetratricopeptide repeat protein [Verrucomicrobiae bacterium]
MRPFPQSRIWFAIVALAFLAAGFSARAQSPALSERPSYVAALTALREGRPGLAAEKLDQLLEAAGNLPADEAESLRLLRLQALVRSRAASAALATLEDNAFPTSPEREFWHGLALAQARRFREALEILTPLAADSTGIDDYRIELAQNLAFCQHRVGDSDAALATLSRLLSDESLTPANRHRLEWLAARIELDRGRPDEAETWLAKSRDQRGFDPGLNPVLSAPDGGTPFSLERELLAARIASAQGDSVESANHFQRVIEKAPDTPAGDRAVLGLTDLAIDSERFRQAAQLLQTFIAGRPTSPLLGGAFQRLQALGAEKVPGLYRKLEGWSADDSEPARHALALFYFAVAARDSGKTEVAVAALNDFLATYQTHPLRESARLQLADALIDTGRLGEADREVAQLKMKAELPSTRTRIGLLDARLAMGEEDAAEAISDYRKVLENPGSSASSRKTAAFDGALTAIANGDEEGYESFKSELGDLTSNYAPIVGDLMLQRGLFEARKAAPDAFETLEAFVRQFPDHPQLADAQIALAELYLNQVPAQSVSAREHLETARLNPLTLEQREWLDYVAIWVEVSAGEDAAAIAQATEFLEDWPRSERRPSVHMVLGESYLRASDFPGAIDTFEALAAESPDSDLAEPAQFFAARAATQSLDPEQRPQAIELWTRVIERGGDLAPAAQHELGLLHLSLEEFEKAISAFNAVIETDEVAPQLTVAALADKGEALYSQAALFPGDAESFLEAAVEAFQEVDKVPFVSKAWRLQATVRRGKCLEALNRTDDALALYQRIVNVEAPAGPVAAAPTAEFDWYYRAGQAAIRLLQEKGDQEQAVAIADQVAQNAGPRAAEAAQIADRLRLRHFIWQKPGR